MNGILKFIMQAALPQFRGVTFGDPLNPGAGVPGATPPFAPPPQSEEPIPAPQPVAPPAAPVAPAPQKRGGILGALGSVFAPEGGSFMHSALANGLWDAKAGQQRYKAGSYDYGREATSAGLNDAKLRELLDEEKNGAIQTSPTGQVLRTKRDGSVEVLWTPPAPKSREEKLVELWKATEDPNLKDMILRAIPGYQYSPEYREAVTQDKIRIKSATPGKAPSSGSSATKYEYRMGPNGTLQRRAVQ